MVSGRRRVLVKLSGEVLAGTAGNGIDAVALGRISDEFREGSVGGVEIGVVIGGGNIIRGTAAAGDELDRTTADSMGMLGTVINALALQDALEHRGLTTRVLSAIEMRSLAEPYIRRRAVRHLEKERIVIMAAGTGNPYFTTDTAAALRAIEIGADVILKATKVDGVYSGDPVKDRDVTFFPRITYKDILDRGLGVMDLTAVTLCKENRLPIVVFNLGRHGNLLKVAEGETVGTSVGER